jgi:predicted  nucleic acid-binding Zn-ribbon protein
VDRPPSDDAPNRPDRTQEHPLNAEPAAQLRLLDVQALDSRIDQLAHQERTLPQHARIAELDSSITLLRDRIVAAETEETDVARQQAKADSDVEQVRQRAARDQQRLDSGAITSAKDLESLQHELVSLARRQTELEDVELEVMERLEDVQQRLAALRTELTAAETERAEVARARDEAVAGIAAERTLAEQQRRTVADNLPEDLATLYAKLRADNGGVGAARLYRGRCEGCRLEINNVEIARIRTAEPDEVLRCEECRRILVRTSESGL